MEESVRADSLTLQINLRKRKERYGSEKTQYSDSLGDDIGMWNIGHYSRGMMGYQTPNIDRVAKEGVTFTDWYGQQSCTADAQHSSPGRTPCARG